MANRALIIGAVLASVCLSPQELLAKPKSTTFREMIEFSSTIAIAKYDEAPDYGKNIARLELLKIIKGDLQPGVHVVPFADKPHKAKKGEKFVVFLDREKFWRFVAWPLGGDAVEECALRIRGFYDRNAYFVSPGIVTLDQLRGFVQERKLVYRFRGDLLFPEPKRAEWKAGSLTIKGVYDAVEETANIEGLPTLQGIANQPTVDVGISFVMGLQHPYIELGYAGGVKRPLTLTGRVDGLDPDTGELLVRFVVTSPDVVTQKDFEEYLANPKSSGPYYKFKLDRTSTKDGSIPKTMFLYDLRNDQRSWRDTVLEGYGKSPLRQVSSSTYDNTLGMTMKSADQAVALVLEFHFPEPGIKDDLFSWSFQPELPYAIYRAGPVPGSIYFLEGKTRRKVASFTATLDSIGMNRNED